MLSEIWLSLRGLSKIFVFCSERARTVGQFLRSFFKPFPFFLLPHPPSPNVGHLSTSDLGLRIALCDRHRCDLVLSVDTLGEFGEVPRSCGRGPQQAMRTEAFQWTLGMLRSVVVKFHKFSRRFTYSNFIACKLGFSMNLRLFATSRMYFKERGA